MVNVEFLDSTTDRVLWSHNWIVFGVKNYAKLVHFYGWGAFLALYTKGEVCFNHRNYEDILVRVRLASLTPL